MFAFCSLLSEYMLKVFSIKLVKDKPVSNLSLVPNNRDIDDPFDWIILYKLHGSLGPIHYTEEVKVNIYLVKKLLFCFKHLHGIIDGTIFNCECLDRYAGILIRKNGITYREIACFVFLFDSKHLRIKCTRRFFTGRHIQCLYFVACFVLINIAKDVH